MPVSLLAQHFPAWSASHHKVLGRTSYTSLQTPICIPNCYCWSRLLWPTMPREKISFQQQPYGECHFRTDIDKAVAVDDCHLPSIARGYFTHVTLMDVGLWGVDRCLPTSAFRLPRCQHLQTTNKILSGIWSLLMHLLWKSIWSMGRWINPHWKKVHQFMDRFDLIKPFQLPWHHWKWNSLPLIYQYLTSAVFTVRSLLAPMLFDFHGHCWSTFSHRLDWHGIRIEELATLVGHLPNSAWAIK